MTDYNGWKNRATWNVALWINNDETLYKSAETYMRECPQISEPYKSFISYKGYEDRKTRDGIAFCHFDLDYKELDEMMRELI